MSRLELVRGRACEMELALGKKPKDARRLQKLADEVVEVASACGFYPELGDKYDSLFDSAIEMYRQAEMDRPNDGVLLNNLGAALCDRGRHSEAVKVLRRAVQRLPKDRNARFNLGVALVNASANGRSEAPDHFAAAADLKRGRATREAYFDLHGH